MKYQFRPFLRRLKISGYHSQHIALIGWVLDQLHKRAMNTRCSVWSELYELKIYCIADKKLIEGSKISGGLRNFLVEQQKNRCCYCQRFLFNIAYARPVEHILPVAHYPRYSLTFSNLAVACYDCNQAKDDNKWWPTHHGRGAYPVKQRLNGAFHARFHRYDDHISWFRYSANNFTFSAYAGLTAEGRKLCVDLLHKVVEKEILLIRDDGLKEALETLNQHNASDTVLPELDAFMAQLQAKILPGGE